MKSTISLLFMLYFFISTLPVNYRIPLKTTTKLNVQTQIKQKAFTVLKTKCNVCHASKKRLILFTLANMDSLKTEIHDQVFVKRKMPKGKKNRLSLEEENNLENWIKMLK